MRHEINIITGAAIEHEDDIPGVEPTLEEKLATAKTVYADKLAVIKDTGLSTFLSDGASMESSLAALRVKYKNCVAERKAILDTLLEEEE